MWDGLALWGDVVVAVKRCGDSVGRCGGTARKRGGCLGML
jgi:hypothetical protein